LKNRIAVIGASKCNQKKYSLAFEIGKLLAENNVILYNAGRFGVIKAMSKSFSQIGEW